MLLNVGICEDEPNDIEVIRKHLTHYEMAHDIDFQISTFPNGSSLLDHYTGSGAFHILFLDVELPGENGLKIANFIRNNLDDHSVKIIFVSNYPDYMQDSFNVQAFHYISKPFKRAAFDSVMELVLADIERNHRTKLLIHEDESEELVYLSDICVISTENSKKKLLRISLRDREICAVGRIADWEKDLLANGFFSPSRGCLVNMKHIHYIKGTSLILDNGTSIPLSRRNEKELRKRFHNNLLNLTSCL